MIRKSIFWVHLICGVIAGLVVFWMSLTGTLLTYERQIITWELNEVATDVSTHKQLATMDYQKLWQSVKALQPTPVWEKMVVHRSIDSVLEVKAGRSSIGYINRYTGEPIDVDLKAKEIFQWITALHRWFNLSGDTRSVGRAVTGISNLIFLFLIISGMYLWLPRLWRWAMFRNRLLFVKTPNSKSRDYNWHHVLGVWSAVPLLVIVMTALVFSFAWANKLVFVFSGEQVPSRSSQQFSYTGAVNFPVDAIPLAWEALFANVKQQSHNWQSIEMTIPMPQENMIQFLVNSGNGGQPHLRETLVLNRYTGEVLATEKFSDRSTGIRLRSIVRFLHTGEVLGWVGQTIAGLVSLASLFMVWTGLALSYRRLIQPILQSKHKH